jgi:hypothetical protein
MKSQVETKKYGFQRERGFAFFLPSLNTKEKEVTEEGREGTLPPSLEAVPSVFYVSSFRFYF